MKINKQFKKYQSIVEELSKNKVDEEKVNGKLAEEVKEWKGKA